MKTALLCSGQGSQYVGMLKDLANEYQYISELINESDKIVGYSLSDIYFNGPIERLKETRYTQPAIFIHSLAAFKLIQNKIDFVATAGHSIGEYAALCIAGVLKFEDALKLVSLRGQLMFDAGETTKGTMFAIIGLQDEKVIQVCEELNATSKENIVVPANFNSPGQVVVSGSADFLRNNVELFKQAGAKIVKELVVSGAFHSPLMMPAQKKLTEAINSTKFEDAKFPVYSNVYAKPLIKADELRESLTKQLTSPVKWTQLITKMNSDGITNFIELGPGQVLQGLVKRILDNIETSGIDKLEHLEIFNNKYGNK